MLKKAYLVVCFLMMFVGCSFADGVILRSGVMSPHVQLPNLENKLVSLYSLIGKKPTILVFFTSWSDTCGREIKFLQNKYSKNKDKFEIVAVSFDNNIEKLKSFVEKNNISFTVLLDKKRQYVDEFQIILIPKVVIISKSGIITNIFDDYDDNVEKMLDKEFDRLISLK